MNASISDATGSFLIETLAYPFIPPQYVLELITIENIALSENNYGAAVLALSVKLYVPRSPYSNELIYIDLT